MLKEIVEQKVMTLLSLTGFFKLWEELRNSADELGATILDEDFPVDIKNKVNEILLGDETANGIHHIMVEEITNLIKNESHLDEIISFFRSDAGKTYIEISTSAPHILEKIGEYYTNKILLVRKLLYESE